jgi:hypothetical protein
MVAKRSLTFALPALLLAVAAAPPAQCSSFSFTGTFNRDDNVRLFGFTLSTPSTVTLETWSYGGGTDAAGQVIPRGGFSTVLSVFSGSGSLIGYQINGGCPPQNIDSTTLLCGDTVLKESNLAVGNYLVAVTEDINIPNGLNLSSGFFEDGMGNFSGPAFCASAGSFKDFGCNQRTGNFELDILGANTATPVPEPAAFVLAGCGLLAIFEVIRHKRRASQVHDN